MLQNIPFFRRSHTKCYIFRQNVAKFKEILPFLPQNRPKTRENRPFSAKMWQNSTKSGTLAAKSGALVANRGIFANLSSKSGALRAK